jgi:predicted dehydrogenase
VPTPGDAPGLKWGIIAPGGIANRFARAIRAHTRQEIAAVGSRSLERAQQFAERYQIEKAYGSYEELVADPEVQAIYVSSPHSQHCEQALLSIAGGKHVLVEKAFARNAADGQLMVDAARQAGVALMEAMWTRFLPGIDIIRQLLADGALGDIRLVAADHGQDLRHVPRLLDPDTAGGALLDLGVYVISFAAFALGQPGAITARGSLLDSGVDAQEAMILNGYAAHPGAEAVLHATMSARTPTTAIICGTDGRIELDSDFYTPQPVHFIAPDNTRLTSPSPRVHLHQALCYEAEHFATMVAEGRTESEWLPLEETLEILRTMDEVRAQLGVRFPGE